MSNQSFEALLASNAADIESLLSRLLDAQHPLVAGTPDRLLAAIRHGVLNGGKRLRPFLVAESARLFGERFRPAALVAGAALECVHSYSLIHDDLPAMDDDDLRRGQPTVHRRFDEATAILAGDALLTLAFAILAEEGSIAAESRLALVGSLANAAGMAGMAGGQMLDLAAERSELSEQEITRMQAMKTGALIAYAAEAGAIVAGAPQDDRARLRRYGETVGLAFQLADDLLDETADGAVLGKAAGKDRAKGKKTLPALHGHDWTMERLRSLVSEAEDLLVPFGERGRVLADTARFIATRKN